MNTPDSSTPSQSSQPLQLNVNHTRRVRISRQILRRLGEFVVIRGMMKLTIVGLENFPRTGPTIVLFNHLTILDPVVIALGITMRDVVPIGKEELKRNPLIAPIMWGWDAIPLKRGAVDRTALKRAIEVINSETALMIAPEGHRQKQGLHDPKEGFALLGAKTNAVMVPIGISGTENFWHNLSRLKRTPITMTIGQPFRLKASTTRKQYAQAAHEIMYRLAPLVTPNLRGDYADLAKATQDTIELV